MQVKDLMNMDVIKVQPSTLLAELITLFKEFHTFPMVPVVDDDDRLIGKVSFENLLEVFYPHTKDIRRLLKAVPFLDQEDPLNIFKVEITPEMAILFVVEDFMDTKVLSVREDEDVEDAYKVMKMNNREHIPVVNHKGELVGMLGIFDIVLALFRKKGIVK